MLFSFLLLRSTPESSAYSLDGSVTDPNADESVAWNGYSGLAALACVVNPRRCEGVCLCCYVHFLDSFRGRTEGSDNGDADFLVLGRKPRRAGRRSYLLTFQMYKKLA